MKTMIDVVISNTSNIILELDDVNSPQTVKQFLSNLPFTLTQRVG
ncbi:hypothetical protein [Nitrosopumilus sp.]|nr:hypothetical protein [Nitrosopumilus sp.]